MNKNLFTIAIASCILLFTQANCQTSQTGYPITATQTSETTREWGDLSYVKLCDGNLACSDIFSRDYSEAIKATNFDFHIPTSATITGYKVHIRRKSRNCCIQDSKVKLLLFDTEIGENKKKSDDYPYTLTTCVYGSSTSDWGVTLSTYDVNSSSFGIIFKCFNNDYYSPTRVVYLDYIGMTVFYRVGSRQFEQTSSGVINSESLIVSPNPAVDHINYKVEGIESFNAAIKIYNTVGDLIINNENAMINKDELQVLDVSKLKSGEYILRVESADKKVYTKRFIKL